MKQQKKVAIYGGSFNPIHNGHIGVIKILLKSKLADEFWIMPCRKHAFNKELASTKNRLEMIKLAIKKLKKVKICKIELESRGKNYTIDTIKKLKLKYPNKFLFVIGSDILHSIKKWHGYEQLLNEVDFIVFKRQGYSIINVKGMKSKIIKNSYPSISSTQVRENIKNDKSIKKLVPNQVLEYMKKNKLYKD